MIRQRVISGAVIAVLLLATVLLLPRLWSAGALSLILLVAAFEWSGFIDTHWTARRLAFLVLTGLACVLAWRVSATAQGLRAALWLALAFWTAMAAWVFVLPGKTGRPAVFASGVLALSLAWMALVRMRIDWPAGQEAVLYSLLIVWLADSGAYFAGRAWGVRKLAPQVSPGKTVAGLWGGVAACALLAAACLRGAVLAWSPGCDHGRRRHLLGRGRPAGKPLQALCRPQGQWPYSRTWGRAHRFDSHWPRRLA
jgi:phosphatidate cytidylyltransferase